MGIVAAANPLIQKPNQILIKRMSPGRIDGIHHFR